MKPDNDFYDEDRDSVFHERIDILKDQGYRGFTVSGGTKSQGGAEIFAKNISGITLKTKGGTKEEAYKKMIDLIDHTLDDV
jgi:hypothetical protein